MSLCVSVAIPQTEEAVGLMAVVGPVAGAGQSQWPVLEKFYICFPPATTSTQGMFDPNN